MKSIFSRLIVITLDVPEKKGSSLSVGLTNSRAFALTRTTYLTFDIIYIPLLLAHIICCTFLTMTNKSCRSRRLGNDKENAERGKNTRRGEQHQQEVNVNGVAFLKFADYFNDLAFISPSSQSHGARLLHLIAR